MGDGGSLLNAALGTFSYAYDTKGNIVDIAESGLGAGTANGSIARKRSYQLDIINRLTQVSDSSATLESYALDEEGRCKACAAVQPF